MNQKYLVECGNKTINVDGTITQRPISLTNKTNKINSIEITHFRPSMNGIFEPGRFLRLLRYIYNHINTKNSSKIAIYGE